MPTLLLFCCTPVFSRANTHRHRRQQIKWRKQEQQLTNCGLENEKVSKLKITKYRISCVENGLILVNDDKNFTGIFTNQREIKIEWSTFLCGDLNLPEVSVIKRELKSGIHDLDDEYPDNC